MPAAKIITECTATGRIEPLSCHAGRAGEDDGSENASTGTATHAYRAGGAMALLGRGCLERALLDEIFSLVLAEPASDRTGEERDKQDNEGAKGAIAHRFKGLRIVRFP